MLITYPFCEKIILHFRHVSLVFEGNNDISRVHDFQILDCQPFTAEHKCQMIFFIQNNWRKVTLK